MIIVVQEFTLVLNLHFNQKCIDKLTFLGVRNKLPETIPFPSVMNFTLTFTNWVSNISGSSGMDAFLTGSFLFSLADSGGFLGSGGGIFNN